MANIPLKGSERAAVPGARVLEPADPAERLEVSVIVRRRAVQRMRERIAALSIAGRAADYLSREAFAREHGANGDFSAQAGWDACTGLGSPNGGALAGIV
jgi:kumamolisin